MKVLVTGSKGMLGSDIVDELQHRNIEHIGLDIDQMDITNDIQVNQILTTYHPDVVIHCAAWTAVDDAELADNQKAVKDVNVKGTQNLVEACSKIGAKFLYPSTDYVFSGKGNKPWRSQNKEYCPLNYYGMTKMLGEKIVNEGLQNFFIVRISWVFGSKGNNFIKTMLNLGERLDYIRVVNDQIGLPTYTKDLARLFVDMIHTEEYGYYHATNSGEFISWYQLALKIFEFARELGYKNYDDNHLKVEPVSTLEYGLSKANRPYNSRLDLTELKNRGFDFLPEWQDAVYRYVKSELKQRECHD